MLRSLPIHLSILCVYWEWRGAAVKYISCHMASTTPTRPHSSPPYTAGSVRKSFSRVVFHWGDLPRNLHLRRVLSGCAACSSKSGWTDGFARRTTPWTRCSLNEQHETEQKKEKSLQRLLMRPLKKKKNNPPGVHGSPQACIMVSRQRENAAVRANLRSSWLRRHRSDNSE